MVDSFTSPVAPGGSGTIEFTFTPAAALPIALSLENGNFNANAYNSQNSTAPNGWTSSLVGTAGNYGQFIPNVANLPALFWARSGNFIQQDLTVANAGLTAGQITGVSVSFARAYRNDVVTKGDILVRLSLLDLTTDMKIAGRDVVIEDTGVKAGAERNLLTVTGVTLPVTGGAANPVAIRIATLEPVLAANQFEATAIIDNLSIAISGSYDPSTPFEDWALAAGLDGAPGKEEGPADDPDKDGASNPDEFAFGSEPLSGSSRGLVAALTADTNSDSRDEFLLTLSACAATFPALEAATISVESATTVNFTSAGTGPTGASTEYVWNGGTSTYTSGSANGDQRLVEGVTLTFNIDPGVIVSGGRFFIGTIDNSPNSITVGPAIWNTAGGGVMNITRTGAVNLRLARHRRAGSPRVDPRRVFPQSRIPHRLHRHAPALRPARGPHRARQPLDQQRE